MTDTAEYLPPLVIGVIGDQKADIFNQPAVRQSIQEVLGWLKEDNVRPDRPLEMQQALGAREIPIVLLTSLVSEAEIWTAKMAQKRGMRLCCPMAFPQKGCRRRKLGDLCPREVFVVETAQDEKSSASRLAAQLRLDLVDCVGRRLRRRAAAEYVSFQADILIAIGDIEEPDRGNISPSGQAEVCREVVRSRLQGLEPGVLPVGTSLSWADNGPVIRVYCPAKTSSAAKHPGVNSSSGPEAGEIEFWHPQDVKEPEKLPAARDELNKREMKSLRDYVGSFARLQKRLEAQKGRRDLHAAEVLLREAKAYRPTTEMEDCIRRAKGWITKAAKWIKSRIALLLDRQAGDQDDPPPAGSFPTAAMRRIAVTRRMISNLNATLNTHVSRAIYLLLALSLALVVTLQVNEARSPAGDEALLLPGVAVLMFFLGWVAYRFTRDRLKLFDLQNDTRAISEGLRVQFYWMAAGLGIPVADHYLQRCRGGASWIRGAISNLCFPLEGHRRAFDALPPQTRHGRLQKVVSSWVAEQEAYFAKQVHTQSRAKSRRTFFGHLFLVAGAVFFVANAFQKSGSDVPAFFGPWGWTPLFVFGMCLITLWWLRESLFDFARPGQNPREDMDFWWKADQNFRQLHLGWLFWPMGLLLGWAALCSMHQDSWMSFFDMAPAPENWDKMRGVVKNLLFATGGFCHALNSFRFATENGRRYSAMHDLFRAAHVRLDDLLKQHQQAIQNGVGAEQLQTAIQDYLRVLGEEALHENSAWLEMRRDKPVEPLTPGG